MKPLKICFISLNSYPLFLKKSTGYFGGAEVQISLIVKELMRDKKFEVSLIVGDYGQNKIVKKGRLTIYKSLDKNEYIMLSFLKAFITMVKIKADVFVARTANPLAGVVAIFCKLFNKKFVYMAAHEWDCQKDFGNYLKNIRKLFFRLGLIQADLIIVQTKTQQKNLKKDFGLSSQLMASVIKPWKLKKTFKREFILWVSRADDWKRPLSYIKLAKKIPQQKFVMICRQGKDIKLFNQVKKQAKFQSNLKFLPVIPIEEIMRFFAKAKLFINTSEEEGFPNTFLQAGMTKTPVLSLKVNPNQYFNKYNCGLVADNKQKQMTKLCYKMLNNPKMLAIMGDNHYDYVKKNHSFKNINIFKQVLLELF